MAVKREYTFLFFFSISILTFIAINIYRKVNFKVESRYRSSMLTAKALISLLFISVWTWPQNGIYVVISSLFPHMQHVSAARGGHSLRIRDGYVRPHWPPFSNLLSLNDPLFIFHILLSPNDPHFQNVLSLNDPILRNKMLSLDDPISGNKC